MVDGHIDNDLDNQKMTDNKIIEFWEEISKIIDASSATELRLSAGTVKVTYDLINRQKAEIERLQEELDFRQVFIGVRGSGKSSSIVRALRDLDSARAEAIKEFAERLTDIICNKSDESLDNPDGSNYFIPDVLDDIDNLVKEMTEIKERFYQGKEQNNV
jgi:hypothetical protein